MFGVFVLLAQVGTQRRAVMRMGIFLDYPQQIAIVDIQPAKVAFFKVKWFDFERRRQGLAGGAVLQDALTDGFLGVIFTQRFESGRVLGAGNLQGVVFPVGIIAYQIAHAF